MKGKRKIEHPGLPSFSEFELKIRIFKCIRGLKLGSVIVAYPISTSEPKIMFSHCAGFVLDRVVLLLRTDCAYTSERYNLIGML